MTTRRAFIVQLTLTLPPLLAGLDRHPSATTTLHRMSDTAHVTLDRMLPWIHRRFRVLQSEAAQELELIAAVPLPRHRPGVAEKFSLVFAGPAHRGLRQQIYRLDHPEAGHFDLFLVPVAAPEPGIWHYEAIINREVPPASPALPPSVVVS